MGDFFGRSIAIVLLVVLIFIIPIGCIQKKTEKQVTIYVREVAEAFLADIIKEGRITVTTWEDMLRSTECSGRMHSVEVTIGKRKDWYEEDNKAENLYSVVYGTEYEKKLYEDGVYHLGKGDLVSITIERKMESDVPEWIYRLLGMPFGNRKIKLGAIAE